MRTNGIDEKYITGNGDDFEKWKAFAKTMPLLIGNPLYRWTHLEIQRYFKITEPLFEKNALEVWNKVNSLLASDEYSAQGLIKMSNVETICTTDNLYDNLEYHKKLRNFSTKVVPTFKPDSDNLKNDITERKTNY